MNKITRVFLYCLGLLLAVLGAPSAMAQATAESTLTTEAATLLTAGTNVGIAALAIFAGLLIFGVVKRFFMAGK